MEKENEDANLDIAAAGGAAAVINVSNETEKAEENKLDFSETEIESEGGIGTEASEVTIAEPQNKKKRNRHRRNKASAILETSENSIQDSAVNNERLSTETPVIESDDRLFDEAIKIITTNDLASDAKPRVIRDLSWIDEDENGNLEALTFSSNSSVAVSGPQPLLPPGGESSDPNEADENGNFLPPSASEYTLETLHYRYQPETVAPVESRSDYGIIKNEPGYQEIDLDSLHDPLDSVCPTPNTEITWENRSTPVSWQFRDDANLIRQVNSKDQEASIEIKRQIIANSSATSSGTKVTEENSTVAERFTGSHTLPRITRRPRSLSRRVSDSLRNILPCLRGHNSRDGINQNCAEPKADDAGQTVPQIKQFSRSLKRK